MSKIQIPQLAGLWTWEGRPLNQVTTRNGRILLELTQKGSALSGKLAQINAPIGPGDFSDIPTTFPTTYDADIEGHFDCENTENPKTILYLKRTQLHSKEIAYFTGNVSDDHLSVEGHFANTWGDGYRGWFVMKKLQICNNNNAQIEPAHTEAEKDRRQILELLTSFEREMLNKKEKDLLDLYLSADTAVHSWTGQTHERCSTAAVFVKQILSYPAASERYDQIIINVKGGFATGSARFHWLEDGTRTGGGEMAWCFMKTVSGWKISHQVWQNK